VPDHCACLLAGYSMRTQPFLNVGLHHSIAYWGAAEDTETLIWKYLAGAARANL
jgi:hypothetical protein